MRAAEFINKSELEEGLLKNLAVAGGIGLGAMGAMHMADKPKEPAAQTQQVTQVKKEPGQAVQAAQAAQALRSPLEKMIYNTGLNVGMQGDELAQFLAQTSHETGNYSSMHEKSGGENYFAKKYDKKYSPRVAKILGNKYEGDGEKYKGRGFIQLTGRDNYTRASKALGIDLVNNPELAADPQVALKTALWFWNNRVKPAVDDFNDTEAVTKRINSGLAGLKDRKDKFLKYKKIT